MAHVDYEVGVIFASALLCDARSWGEFGDKPITIAF